MKKILCLGMLLCGLLTGCGSKVGINENVMSENSSVAQTTSIMESTDRVSVSHESESEKTGLAEASVNQPSIPETDSSEKTVTSDVSDVKDSIGLSDRMIGDSSSSSLQEGMEEEFELVNAFSFKDGYAWIAFRKVGDEDNTYMGFIDENGKLHNYYTVGYGYVNLDLQQSPINEFSGITSPNYGCDTVCPRSCGGASFSTCNTFENGYRYLFSGNNVNLIDITGEVKKSYPLGYILKTGISSSTNLSSQEKAICFGNGCFVLGKHIESFDENKYVYRLVDKDGNELYRFESENLSSCSYIGNGIFSLDEIYFSTTGYHEDYYIEGPLSADFFHTPEQYSLDDIIFFRQHIDNSKKYDGLSLTQFYREDGLDWNDEYMARTRRAGHYIGTDICAINGDYALCRKDKDYYALYDFTTGEYKVYQGKWKDSLYWSEYESQCCGISAQGTFAIGLEGQDGKKYIGLIDKNMNEICEPILCASGVRSRVTFCITDDYLYVDGDGANKIYTLDGEDTFYSNIVLREPFSEGIAVCGKKEPFYVDKNFNKVFDIDFSTGKYVPLNS